MVIEIISQYLGNLGLQNHLPIVLSNLFLIFIGLVWLVISVIQDFRKREVANWWSFSLIIFILCFRAFTSVQTGDYWYFLWGIIGLAVGFILANILYYARLFAGGDFKLLFALGVLLPMALDWKMNLIIFIAFILFFILMGSIYGLVYSIILGITYRKRFALEFKKQLKENLKLSLSIMIFSVLIFLVFLFMNFAVGEILSVVLFISPILLVCAKAIEESCMIKFVRVKDLTVGDWIVDNIRVGKKIIEPNWEGLSEEELKLIQRRLNKNKKISVKEGIPFTPAFLLGFILLVYVLYNLGL